MDLSSLKTIKNLLKARQIRPSKGLGQNFLINKQAVKKIIEAAELQPDETILEIGPGLGVLTQELARRAKKVIAVEKDRNMVEILKETLREYKNVEVIQEDIRKFDSVFEVPLHTSLCEVELQTHCRTSQISKVVGNLPFYLTAPVIRQFLEWLEARPLTMVFMVQKEVAQRLCAKVPDMNLLAVSVQFYAEPKIISYVSKNSFWPSPKVDAAIIKIIPRVSENHAIAQKATNSANAEFSAMFFKVVRAGFSQPRKQLINNLSKGLRVDKNKAGEWLLANGIQPSQRAETLTIKNWTELTNSLVSNNIETEV